LGLLLTYIFRNEAFYSDDEDFLEQAEMEESQSSTNNQKWLGCANHILQLALKILNVDPKKTAPTAVVKFSETMDGILEIVRKIRRSSSARNEFYSQTGRSIVLPVATR